MVGTRRGDLTASVQRVVGVGEKHEPELAPILHPLMEGRIAAAWDLPHQPYHAKDFRAQVS